MAEHFLNRPQIGSGIEQVRCKRVAQTVRSQMLPQAAPLELGQEDAVHGTAREPTASSVPEQSVISLSGRRELKIQDRQILGDRLHCFCADGNDPFLAALAQDPYHTGP